MKIHPTADVQTRNIGQDTTIWQFVVILKGATIGNNCNINCHVFIENDVTIGSNVTIKPGVQIWDGIQIEDNVFIGPNVSFTNDKIPRSKQYPEIFQKTVVKKNASIGAGAIILGGCNIGEYSMVGAGSLVTKEVPDCALVVGHPARVVAWLNKDGSKMKKIGVYFTDNEGQKWKFESDRLIKV